MSATKTVIVEWWCHGCVAMIPRQRQRRGGLLTLLTKCHGISSRSLRSLPLRSEPLAVRPLARQPLRDTPDDLALERPACPVLVRLLRRRVRLLAPTILRGHVPRASRSDGKEGRRGGGGDGPQLETPRSRARSCSCCKPRHGAERQGDFERSTMGLYTANRWPGLLC